MKKVLFIVEALSGGVRKHVVQLIENLDENKFEIYLIHGTTRIDDTFLENRANLEQRCKLIPCDSLVREINIKNDFLSVLFVVNHIKKIQPDVVHCHSSKAGVIGRVSAKICGVQNCYYTPHAYSFLAPEFCSVKKRLFIYFERILSRYATTETFTVSIGERKSALDARVDNIEKLDVIYNGLPEVEVLEKSDAKEKLGFSKGDFIVGNCARLNDQKDPFTFIEIAKNVIDENPNVFFVWIGDGPLKERVNHLIKAYNLQKNVKLFGHRTDSDEIVAAYDLFLTTSLYEGLPYSPIEALRAGVPVLATDVTGNNEIVDDGVNGYLLKDDVISSGRKMISEILDGTIQIDSEEVKDTFYKKFSLKTMIDKISEEYVG